MKRKFFFLALLISLTIALFAGSLLFWASFQSFERLSSLLDRLASDGNLEIFNESLYLALKMPLALVGMGLILFAGFTLIQWKQVRGRVEAFPINARNFFHLLRQDTHIFWHHAARAIKDLGQRGIAALTVLMLAALVIRLGKLDLPLGHDEAYMYNAFASRSFWHIVSDYHLPNNHVLLSIIIKIVTGLLGNHVWALRLPTIVAGVFMVPAAYFFARRFYSRESAVLSALLVAAFPILVQYSVLARGYVVIGLATLVLFVLGDYVKIHQNRFAWLLIVLVSTLGFFTIPVMLFPFGAFYIWLLVSWGFKDTHAYESRLNFLKYWLVSGFGAALVTFFLYLPIIVNNPDRFFGNGFIAPLAWDIFPVTIWTRLRNTWIDWTSNIPPLISLIGAAGVLVSLLFHKQFSEQKFTPQLAFIIWIGALLIARRPDMLPRFWLFLAAPVLVWAAAGVVEPLRLLSLSMAKKWTLAQAFVGLLVALVVLQGLWTIPKLPSVWNSRDGMANATLFLKDSIRQGDLVTATPVYLPALRYYFNYYGLPKGHIRQAGEFQRAFVIVDGSKAEMLETVAPQLDVGVPAIDMKTVKVVYQQGNFTVYECYPIP